MFKLDIFKTLHICTEHGKSFMHGTTDPVYQICSFKDGDILGQDYDRIRDQGSGGGGGPKKCNGEGTSSSLSIFLVCFVKST